ncbi:DUF5655 domain-containing protein [Natroniella acetigena]|uniref:DUF5655 domain-containing protein n=1 Tax=Natroniella acetigena TaxID=52004 RepID=UPI00200AF76A|nr:DUF5655 domain-containing protein [Natroniella acetigena]MCK8827746.1 DUF5655 domain-containing protein [Natroniella acetigena]
MSFNLYRITDNEIKHLKKNSFKLEKELQNLIEDNLEEIFGIKFLASEYSTGQKHGGRMDTLGIDENNSPVILEYKRNQSQNMINQALFYLDWLLDHKATFEMLVQKKLGADREVEWSLPRVLCIAEKFNKYDTYAVSQMGRPIELIQYQLFEEGLLNIEVITSNEEIDYSKPVKEKEVKKEKDYELKMHFDKGKEFTVNLFKELQGYILGLGDDVVENITKHYIAYRSVKNFVCLEIHKKHLLMYLSISPEEVDLEDNRLRDVRSIGHYGTGDLEVRIESAEDIIVAKNLIEKAYKFLGE